MNKLTRFIKELFYKPKFKNKRKIEILEGVLQGIESAINILNDSNELTMGWLELNGRAICPGRGK